MFTSFFEQGKKKRASPKQATRGQGRTEEERKKERDLPTRSSSVAVPGETGDLRVAATAEALAADSRYAGLVTQACQIIDAFDGFAGLRGITREMVSYPLLFRFPACLIALTYLAEAARAKIVSASDGTFFQCRHGACKGGETEDGGHCGGEVDHSCCGGDG